MFENKKQDENENTFIKSYFSKKKPLAKEKKENVNDLISAGMAEGFGPAESTVIKEEKKLSIDEQIKESISFGLLPNKEKVINGIKNGKYSLEEAKNYYASTKNKDKKVESIITEDAVQDLIPVDKDIINYLKINPTKRQEVIDNYSEYKKTYSDYIEPEYLLDKLKSMQDAGLNTGNAEELIKNEFSITKFLGQQLAAGATFGIYQGDLPPLDKTHAMLGFAANIIGSIPSFVLAESLLFGRVAKGATSILASTAEKAASPLVKTALKGLSKTTGALPKISESLAGQSQILKQESINQYRLYRAAKILDKAEEAGEFLNAANVLRKASTSKIIQKTITEQLALGSSVGATKSLVRYATDEDFGLDDALFETAFEALAFPAMAGTFSGAYKLAEGVTEKGIRHFVPGTNEFLDYLNQEAKGLFSSIRFSRRARRAFESEKSLLTNETIQYLSSNGVNKDILNKVSETFKRGETDLRNHMAANVLNKTIISRQFKEEALSGGVKGVKNLAKRKPLGAFESKKIENISQEELLTQPKLLKRSTRKDMAEIFEKEFKEETGMFNYLYKTDKDVQTLINTGQYNTAIDKIKTSVLKDVKKSRDLSDLLAGTSKLDTDIINFYYAKKVSALDKFKKDGTTQESVSQDVFDKAYRFLEGNLEPENEKIISSIKGSRNKLTKKDITSQLYTKLDFDKVNYIITKQLEKNFKLLGNKIKVEDIGKLEDVDSMLKTAISFNENINRSFIQAFKQNHFDSNKNFGNVPNNLRDGVEKGLKKRHYEFETSKDIERYNKLRSKNISEKNDFEILVDDGELKELAKSINYKLKEIKKLDLELSGFNTKENPQGYKQIQDIVSDYWQPNQELLRSKLGAKKDLKVNTYLDYFFDPSSRAQNNFYIKKDSEIADFMHSMLISNKDISDMAQVKWFGLHPSAGINTEGISRTLQREFGMNNVFERSLIRPAKERALLISAKKKEYAQKIKEIGVFADTKLSSIVFDLGEKKITEMSDDFLNLSPADKIKVKNSLKFFTEEYDNLLGAVNEVNTKMNYPVIEKRQDYFRHFEDFAFHYDEAIENYISGSLKQEAKGINRNSWYEIKTNDPNKTNLNGINLRRSEDSMFKYKSDAVGGFITYLDPILKRIYNSDLIREVDVARNLAPVNMHSMLTNFKKDFLIGSPMLIDQMTTKGFKKASRIASKKFYQGALLGKVTSMLNQLMSIPLNYAASGVDAWKALVMLPTKEGKRITSKSLNRQSRDFFEGARGERIMRLRRKFGEKVFGRKAGDFYDMLQDGLAFGLEAFDKVAVNHAYLTGFNKAIREGLTQKQAHRFADKYTDIIQADLTRIGRSHTMNTAIGRAFFQFMSFTTNIMNAIVTDLPDIAFTQGGEHALETIMRTGAGISIANEVSASLGLPIPYNISTFLPFFSRYDTNSRMGSPGIFMTGKAVAGVWNLSTSSDERKTKAAKKDIYKLASSILFPGSDQVRKSGEAIAELYKYDFSDPNDLYDFSRSFTFGPGGKKFYEAENKRRRTEEKKSIKGKLKSYILNK